MVSTEAVFVDLSNVAKDPLLGYSTEHAALSRWDRLRSVWLRERTPGAYFMLIADASLPRALSLSDRSRLATLVERGEAIVATDADVEVLRRAISSGGVALSNDRYVDHRRTEGLEQVALVGWIVRGDSVRLQKRSLSRLLSALISGRAQRQALKELGLSEDSPELQYRWHCTNEVCSSQIVALPRMRSGSPMCPDCDAFLSRGPAWNRPIWIKIMHGPDEVTRFVLEDGDGTFVGQGDGDDVISLGPPAVRATEVDGLDDRHVELCNVNGVLRVRDNSTGSGTRLRRPAAGQLNRLSPPMPVSDSTFTTVGVGTKILLGGSAFTVQLSGGAGT